jgi:hypothetical protein
MNAEMLQEVEARARQRYEWAMLRLGVARASLVTSAVAALAMMGAVHLPSLVWFVPLFGVWLFVGWRGELVWRGALGGLVAGLGALALPLSLLRPCCGPGGLDGASSCSMPQMCVAAGAVLGVVVAATLPRTRTLGGLARASAGSVVGVVSLAACRCASLFVGESVGLLAGLLASTAGLAVARAWWTRRVTAR